TTTAARNCDMFVNPFAPRIKPGIETINGVTVRRFPVFRLFGAPLWFLSRVCHTLRLPYNDRVLAEGMVILLEPGIYLPGVTGVRQEDALLVTADGATVLTHSDKRI
ncbi:MAG: M24 family metallopeptidase, partial [Caldilineaceae bacterium]